MARKEGSTKQRKRLRQNYAKDGESLEVQAFLFFCFFFFAKYFCFSLFACIPYFISFQPGMELPPLEHNFFLVLFDKITLT